MLISCDIFFIQGCLIFTTTYKKGCKNGVKPVVFGILEIIYAAGGGVEYIE
jgi:hypothetical protein